MSVRHCGVVYAGPSCPELHGVRCVRPEGHDNGPPHGSARHYGWAPNGVPIQWFTAEQKAARDAEKAAI